MSKMNLRIVHPLHNKQLYSTVRQTPKPVPEQSKRGAANVKIATWYVDHMADDKFTAWLTSPARRLTASIDSEWPVRIRACDMQLHSQPCNLQCSRRRPPAFWICTVLHFTVLRTNCEKKESRNAARIFQRFRSKCRSFIDWRLSAADDSARCFHAATCEIERA